MMMILMVGGGCGSGGRSGISNDDMALWGLLHGRVTTFQEALDALRWTDKTLTLMAEQRDMIKNHAGFRASPS
jgi:hypothetical protein